MRCLKVAIYAWLAGAAMLAARAEGIRFSEEVTPAERMGIGLQRLSSDQLAILDALVRRDEKWNAQPGSPPPSPARFSQRLSPEERNSAGLDRLDEAHVFRLDIAVARIEFGPPPVRPGGKTSDATLQPQLAWRGLEIHGMLSFMVGGGSGGYS
jgi:hypothetical protein